MRNKKTTKGEAKRFIKKLTRLFHTKKVVFTPLVNTNIETRFRGKTRLVAETEKGNPYGEKIKILEVEWDG